MFLQHDLSTPQARQPRGGGALARAAGDDRARLPCYELAL